MPSTTDDFVKIVNLRKQYFEGGEKRLIFKHLNLVIRQGEFIALAGRSGSGKSTLLNLISGIDLPDTGQIRIDGHVINTLSERERTRFRRRHIGFVFQFFNLIPTLTVEENLFLPLELNNLNDTQHRQQALSMLERVGLSERRKTFPEHLSGGEQQRVAITRALVHEPLLLLADEPTGNLDAETGVRVMEFLLDSQRRVNTTVLMVTHSQEVAAQADRMLHLGAGPVQEPAP